MNENPTITRAVWISFAVWRLVFYRWGVRFVRSELPVFGLGLDEEWL